MIMIIASFCFKILGHFGVFFERSAPSESDDQGLYPAGRALLGARVPSSCTEGPFRLPIWKKGPNTTSYMGGCQNHGPLLNPLNTRCRTILRNQKGTIVLTTTHMDCWT